MSRRVRAITFVVVCVLAVGISTAYVLMSRERQAAVVRAAPTAATVANDEFAGEPRIVFRHTGLGDDYGKVAAVALDDPGGPRAISSQACERVYATSAETLCLSASRGMVTTYRAEVTRGDEQIDLPLAGIPSRARLSADGRLAASTSFVSGDSYAGTNFSTRTVITDLAGDHSVDLEKYRLIHRGKSIHPIDRNFWGVTFAKDDNLFYATVAWGGHTWLVRGNVRNHTVTTLREDAECPSLSPDGTRLVYKKRLDLPTGQWRLASLDLASGKETLLAEQRSVDDQVEWLDDEHVLYGLPRTGDQAATTDVYSVPADGSGQPRLLIKQAWSPSVIRTGGNG